MIFHKHNRYFFMFLLASIFFFIAQSAALSFEYVFGKNIFTSKPNQPKQWESYIDPDTGITIRRITDKHSNNPPAGSGGNTIFYSRKDASSIDGRYLWVNSNGAYYIMDLHSKTSFRAPHSSTDGSVYDRNAGQDCQPEYRFDHSGNHPNRIYWRYGWELYYADLPYTGNWYPQGKLVHNFRKDTDVFGADASDIQNVYVDSEGDSSEDSRYWCFLVRLTSGQYKYAIVYDLQEDKIVGKMDITMFVGINFSDMDPKGRYAILSGQWSSTYGVRTYTWNPSTREMIFQRQICTESAHSGWAQDLYGDFKWIQVNNCGYDYIMAQSLASTGRDYKVMDQGDFCWSGHHINRTYQGVKGWIIMSTYSNGNCWANNQVWAVEMKNEEDNPRVWRLFSTHNKDDANPPAPGGSTAPQASINATGTKIYFGSNWNGTDNFEVYEATLPTNWWGELNGKDPDPPISPPQNLRIIDK